MPARKLHIFTAIRAEAAAIRPILPDGVGLTVIGIRAVRMPAEIAASAILMAGFAGALDPGLRVGDIVQDDLAGSIHTSTDIVATVAAKAELFRRTGAKAVDMENAIVRQFADRLGIRFIGIRAISDTADEAVDPAIMQFIDETGRVRPAALAKVLIQKPGVVPQLNRLRRHSAIAARALAVAVKKNLDENKELFT